MSSGKIFFKKDKKFVEKNTVENICDSRVGKDTLDGAPSRINKFI